MPRLKYRDPLDGSYKDVPLGGGGSSGISRIVSSVSTSMVAAAQPMTDYIYICTAALTLFLPSAASNTNRYTIKRAGSGIVTVTAEMSQTIDGTPDFVLDLKGMSIDLISNGSHWAVV